MLHSMHWILPDPLWNCLFPRTLWKMEPLSHLISASCHLHPCKKEPSCSLNILQLGNQLLGRFFVAFKICWLLLNKSFFFNEVIQIRQKFPNTYLDFINPVTVWISDLPSPLSSLTSSSILKNTYSVSFWNALFIPLQNLHLSPVFSHAVIQLCDCCV